MASGVEMRGADLHLGNVAIPLKTAIGFCILSETKVHIYLTHGEYRTILRLFLESVENMHKCVGALLTRPQIRRSLFCVSRAVPVLKHQKAARVFFRFYDAFNLQCFQAYVKEPGWTVKETAHENGIFFTYEKEEPLEERIQRINDLFNAMRNRFFATGVDEALDTLDDPRFPSLPIPQQSAELPEDHIRYFDVTHGWLVTPDEMEELEAWITDPASQMMSYNNWRCPSPISK